MSEKRRLPELQVLSVLFCLLVILGHSCSHAETVLDKLSWQFAAATMLHRLCFVAVPGFFLLSGVKLTLPQTRPRSFPVYWRKRAKSLLLPYGIAAAVYELYFVRHGYYAFSLPSFLRRLVTGEIAAPFYFLVILVQFVVLAPLFQRLAERYSPVLLLPFAAGITLLSFVWWNDLLHVFAPHAWFAYSDRVFTSWCFYFLAGCCIGARYDAFCALLARHRAFLAVLCAVFAAADGLLTVALYSGRAVVPCLDLVHMLFYLAALGVLYDLALRRRSPLPPLPAAFDRAGFLIYLYHALVILVFDSLVYRLPNTHEGPLLPLRFAVAVLVTGGLCILWQRIPTALRKAREPRLPSN